MRFVPAVATNQSGGGGQWWQVAVTIDLPDLLDASTTVDGTAYSATDGTTCATTIPDLGTGGTVGIDGLALATLDRPEFEIFDANDRNCGPGPAGSQLHGAPAGHLRLRRCPSTTTPRPTSAWTRSPAR